MWLIFLLVSLLSIPLISALMIMFLVFLFLAPTEAWILEPASLQTQASTPTKPSQLLHVHFQSRKYSKHRVHGAHSATAATNQLNSYKFPKATPHLNSSTWSVTLCILCFIYIYYSSKDTPTDELMSCMAREPATREIRVHWHWVRHIAPKLS